MAQSSSQGSGLFSIIPDLFVEKPQPQPQPKPEPPQQQKPIAKRKLPSLNSNANPSPCYGKPEPEPEPEPCQRQDELVKKFPGTSIIRRPTAEIVDAKHIKFPRPDCERKMQKIYEALTFSGKENCIKDYDIRNWQPTILTQGMRY